jgi:DNA-binding MarR family transcriptional regulator
MDRSESNPASAPSARKRKRRSEPTRNPVATALNQWRQEQPELDLEPLGLFAAVAHVYWLTDPAIERLMATHGLTRGMFDVLTTLRRAGPPFILMPKQLGQTLLLSGAGITNRLDRLEALHLIQRLPDPTDRRSLHIKLTTTGLHLVDGVVPELIQLERSMMSELPAGKSAALTRLLDEFARALSAVPARQSNESAKGRTEIDTDRLAVQSDFRSELTTVAGSDASITSMSQTGLCSDNQRRRARNMVS